MLVEAKGTGYARLLTLDPIEEELRGDWMDQATRQVEASGGRKIEWDFAEVEAADYAREIFEDKDNLSRIRVVYRHWREGGR